MSGLSGARQSSKRFADVDQLQRIKQTGSQLRFIIEEKAAIAKGTPGDPVALANKCESRIGNRDALEQCASERMLLRSGQARSSSQSLHAAHQSLDSVPCGPLFASRCDSNAARLGNHIGAGM